MFRFSYKISNNNDINTKIERYKNPLFLNIIRKSPVLVRTKKM